MYGTMLPVTGIPVLVYLLVGAGLLLSGWLMKRRADR